MFPKEASMLFPLSPLNGQRIHLQMLSFKTTQFWHSITVCWGDQGQYRGFAFCSCHWELVNKIFFQFVLSIVIHHVCIRHTKPGNHEALYNTWFHSTAVNARPPHSKRTLQRWVRVGPALSDHRGHYLRSLGKPSNPPAQCLPSPTGFRLQEKAGLYYSLQGFVNRVTRVHNNSCFSEKQIYIAILKVRS